MKQTMTVLPDSHSHRKRGRVSEEVANTGGVITDWHCPVQENLQTVFDGLNNDARAIIPPKQCSIVSV